MRSIPMKATITRKSVAQILRASYALFAKDEETVMAVKMVLGSAIRSST
jgi:hypothetical protein